MFVKMAAKGVRVTLQDAFGCPNAMLAKTERQQASYDEYSKAVLAETERYAND